MFAQRIDDVQADIDPSGVIEPALVRNSLVERVADFLNSAVNLIFKEAEPGKFEFAVNLSIQHADLGLGELFA
ncbi:hypothetical protein D3C73_1324400 [compost metagenome]